MKLPHRVYFLPRCMECRRGLAIRILSVCPSVKRVHCDKTEELRYVKIFIPYERSLSLVFWGEEWLVAWWRQPVLPEILERNRRFWTDNHLGSWLIMLRICWINFVYHRDIEDWSLRFRKYHGAILSVTKKIIFILFLLKLDRRDITAITWMWVHVR